MGCDGRVLPDLCELRVVGEYEVSQDDVFDHGVEHEVDQANQTPEHRHEQQAWKGRTDLATPNTIVRMNAALTCVDGLHAVRLGSPAVPAGGGHRVPLGDLRQVVA